MTGVAVRSLDFAGGAQLAGQQNWFVIEGELVVLKGDPVTPHGPPIPPHTAPVMAEGSDWFTIDGIEVCRAGHAANCGHTTSGRAWFTIS